MVEEQVATKALIKVKLGGKTTHKIHSVKIYIICAGVY